MKIWHQSMAYFSGLSEYGESLNAHAAAVVEPGTEVVIKGMPEGYIDGHNVTTTDLLGSPYLYHIAFRLIIDYARQAESEGYDAFVIGSFSEPFLKEIRATVDIPVASVGESNFLLGCSYGKLQAHIANVPTVARLVTEHVHEYRLTDRVAGVYALGPEMEEIEMSRLWHSPAPLLERFEVLAREAIANGADVLIPAEGVLSEILYQNGVRKIGEAVVFDSFGMAWKYAETLVNIKNRLNITVGREWEYKRASEEKMTTVRSNLGLL
jgi:Asp/Glu/hydantoin racemase